MKNYEWKRISESHEDSSHTYRYACEDLPGVTVTELESRGTAVPGALVIAEDEEESGTRSTG